MFYFHFYGISAAKIYYIFAISTALSFFSWILHLFICGNALRAILSHFKLYFYSKWIISQLLYFNGLELITEPYRPIFKTLAHYVRLVNHFPQLTILSSCSWMAVAGKTPYFNRQYVIWAILSHFKAYL